MIRNIMKRTAILVAALALLTLGGCAGLMTQATPEEQVRQRAQAWADTLLEGNLKEAWAFTSPAYRQFSGPGQYNVEVAGATRWTAAQVDAVECAEDVCEVSVLVSYEIKRLGMKNTRPLDYKWLKADRDWWLYVPIRNFKPL
jgi:uncharacterized protein YceK